MSMKIILIGAILLLGLGYGGAKFYLHYKVSESMDTAVLVMSPYVNFTYEGISSTLSGELTVDDVRVQITGFRDDVVIGRLGINTPNFLELLKLSKLTGGPQAAADKMPEYFGFIAEDIHISPTADYYREFYRNTIEMFAPSDLGQAGVQCVGKYGYSPKALKALGYNDLVISISVILRQTDSAYITELEVDFADMVDYEVSLSVVGDMMSGIAKGAAYRPKLSNFRMQITDHSLNKRINKYCAELGLSPDQILAAHLNALNYFSQTNGIIIDKYLIDPFKQYLAGKPTLVITAKPREPVDFAEIGLYNPIDVPALLNLEAVAL